MPDTLETPRTEQLTQETSPQELNRQALYEQYYGKQGDTAAVAEPAPVTEPVAQTEQAPGTVAPQAVIPQEVLSLMQSMQQELAAVKTQLSQATATSTAAAPPTEPTWVAMLREGKLSEFEDALAAAVGRKTADSLIQQATERSTTQTIERMRAENEIERFTTDLRSQNPELVPMERLIAAGATDRMAVARAQGLIKTTDDAIRIYKQSVTEEVNSARKLYHTLRGDGKQEAQVRQREVLSSRPIPPQQVDTSRPQVTNQEQEPPTETALDYIQKRQQTDNWKKGLAPKPNFIP
jgi:hypothetical protein